MTFRHSDTDKSPTLMTQKVEQKQPYCALFFNAFDC